VEAVDLGRRAVGWQTAICIPRGSNGTLDPGPADRPQTGRNVASAATLRSPSPRTAAKRGERRAAKPGVLRAFRPSSLTFAVLEANRGAEIRTRDLTDPNRYPFACCLREMPAKCTVSLLQCGLQDSGVWGRVRGLWAVASSYCPKHLDAVAVVSRSLHDDSLRVAAEAIHATTSGRHEPVDVGATMARANDRNPQAQRSSARRYEAEAVGQFTWRKYLQLA
jgi:hypothetical protein